MFHSHDQSILPLQFMHKEVCLLHQANTSNSWSKQTLQCYSWWCITLLWKFRCAMSGPTLSAQSSATCASFHTHNNAILRQFSNSCFGFHEA